VTTRRATNDEVREAVRAAVEYLDEEERWVLLQRWLQKETAGRGEAAKRSLRLEALRSIVCPRVGDREWDRILREHRTVQWAGELRLANAFAILSGCDRSQPVPRPLTSQWQSAPPASERMGRGKAPGSALRGHYIGG
jgi:hypothetical protein